MSYPFVIWTMQRTGGTSLTDLLMEMSEHPKAEHEPFNWAKKKPRQFWPITEAWGNTKNEIELHKSLDEIFAERFLIKHCYELHGMPFNIHLMNAAAKTDYRHILLLRRDEAARLISKFVAEGQGTWFKDYAKKVFKEVAHGQRKLGPLPVERVISHYKQCRENTAQIRANLKRLGVDCLEVFYEDLYVGEHEPRLERLHELLDFLGFTPPEVAGNEKKIQNAIFHSGQNTRAVAPFIPNLQDVNDALARAGCPGAVASAGASEEAPVATSVRPEVKIGREFERLVAAHEAQGPFLEIGFGPPDRAALLQKAFEGQERHAIGYGEAVARDGVAFHPGTPNNMRGQFDDGRFSTVFWNGALVHDSQFWLTLDEIKRVLAPGGVLIVAASDFSRSPGQNGIKVVGPKGNFIPNTTVTQSVHATRGDFWRISPQAMRKTILNGYKILEIREVMMPSRVLGVGLKTDEEAQA